MKQKTRQHRSNLSFALAASLACGRAVEFDYTHLGREGADFFSKMVTDERAVQVPAMRQYLIP